MDFVLVLVLVFIFNFAFASDVDNKSNSFLVTGLFELGRGRCPSLFLPLSVPVDEDISFLNRRALVTCCNNGSCIFCCFLTALLCCTWGEGGVPSTNQPHPSLPPLSLLDATSISLP